MSKEDSIQVEATVVEPLPNAMFRLARDNKSNVAPSRWNVLLFATHPPVVERIRMAEEWSSTHKQ